MNAAPGWYPDVTTPGTQRYWDGKHWTEHKAPLERRAVPHSASNLVLIVAGGILAAVFMIWLIGSMLYR